MRRPSWYFFDSPGGNPRVAIGAVFQRGARFSSRIGSTRQYISTEVKVESKERAIDILTNHRHLHIESKS